MSGAFDRLFGKKMRHSNNSEKVICIFATYNIDGDDIRFIEANKDYCTFVVIESLGAPSLFSMRIRSMDGVEYISRHNIGYDVTAWKEFICNNIERLKTYDYVIIANNSCRYDFSIRDTIKDMKRKRATFYGLNYSWERAEHMQSYYNILDKSLVSSDAFIKHWEDINDVSGREDAIVKHELSFLQHMKAAGAKVAYVTDYGVIKNGYEGSRYSPDMEKVPPFIKKKLLVMGTERSKYEQLLKTKPHMI